MVVEDSRFVTDLAEVFLEAGRQLGYRVLDDQVPLLSTAVALFNAFS